MNRVMRLEPAVYKQAASVKSLEALSKWPRRDLYCRACGAAVRRECCRISAPIISRASATPEAPKEIRLNAVRQTAAAGASQYRWYVLGLLVMVYAFHHMDRQVVTLLLEPIKHEFDLSDSQLGFLAGFSYAVSFGIAGIPLGLMVDRVHRVRLLSVLLTIWSGLTALCGLAGSFGALVLARIGIGAAESGGTPTNMSLIADYFSRRDRPTAMGIYYMGTQVGTIIGFAVAAIVAQQYGWRAGFLVAGVPGLLLMLLVLFTIREPRRGAADADEAAKTLPPGALVQAQSQASTLGKTLRFVWSQRAQVHTMTGVVVAMAVTAGMSAWLAPLMIRQYGVNLKTAGITLALGVATFGALGSFIGGLLASRISARNIANLPKLTALATFLTVPAALLGILGGSLWLTIAGFAIQHFFNAMIVSTGYALSLELTRSNMRGTTMALLQVLCNVCGYGLGPQFVGLLSDGLNGHYGSMALPYAMALLALGNIWATAHLVYAARWTPNDLLRASAKE
jgi:predicted MFS family arabinose efflux permease